MPEKKPSQGEPSQGVIESYIHSNKKIGVLLDLRCKTDFAARTEDFQKLAHELCLQIAGRDDEEIPFLEQPWIKDESKTIKQLVDECIGKLRENITIKRFIKYEL